jgi:hypothetical protein
VRTVEREGRMISAHLPSRGYRRSESIWSTKLNSLSGELSLSLCGLNINISECII